MTREVVLRRAGWVVLCVVVLLVYWAALDAPFVYDDKIEVVGNRTLRSLDEWRAVTGYNPSRVVLILTYAWDWSRYGLDPTGYHVTSLVIFGLALAAAIGLADTVGRLGRHPATVGVALGAVAVFALHPMATESVSYVTGRSESLCAFFVFLSLMAWARALLLEREGQAGLAWRILGLLAFVLAVLTKEVGAMLPFALLWMEIALGPTERAWFRRPRWRWTVLLGLVIAAAVALRFQQSGTLLHQEVERGIAVQLTTSAEVWLHYVRLWLLPVGQTIFHHQQDVAPITGHGVLAIGGWLTVVGIAVVWGRRVPLAGWALGTAALFLLPSTSIISLKEHMAEHRAFQLGLYLFLAVGWSIPERWRRPGAVAAGLLLPVLAWATWQRNAVWSSEIAVWTEATEHRPESADAWYGLGDAYRFQAEFQDAEAAYGQAVDLDPNHLDAWNNLGISRAEVGDADGARRAWKSALESRPSYCKAHNNLGSLAYRRKQYDEALTELKSTLAYCPEDVIAHYLLGNIYFGPRRDPQRATVHYEAVISLDPDFTRAAEIKQKLLELTW